MTARMVTVAAALSWVSCKANLEHRYENDSGTGNTDLGAAGVGTGAGVPDHGTMGSGGTPVDLGGMIGTGGATSGGTSSGGVYGSAGAGPDGAGGAAGTAGPALDAGVDLAMDAATDTADAAVVDGAAPPCAPDETRCSGNGMQSCASDGTWTGATLCESGICSGKKCLPKAAILIVAFNVVFTYDASNGAAASSFPLMQTGNSAATLGPDGKLWLADNKSNAIVRYDLSGASLGTLATLQDYAASLAFGPDGNLYASAQTRPRNTIVRINATTGLSTGSFVQGPLDLQIAGIAFHKGSLLVAYPSSGNTGGSLYQYDGTTGALVAMTDLPSGDVRTPVFAPDGNMYVPIWQTPDIAKFDATTFKFITNISRAGLYPTSIAVSPDGNLLVLSDPLGGSDSVERLDPTTGTFLTVIPTGSGGVGRAGAIFYRGS